MLEKLLNIYNKIISVIGNIDILYFLASLLCTILISSFIDMLTAFTIVILAGAVKCIYDMFTSSKLDIYKLFSILFGSLIGILVISFV